MRKIVEIWGTKSSILGLLLEILPFLPTGVSHNHIIQSKYALTSSNQTYILTNTHFRGYWRVFGMQLSSFWSTSPKIYDSWPQISPLLPTTASYNHINQLKYVLISSNQTYLLITTHFSQYKRVFGMLLSDFWSSSPKIDDCWPQISPILPTTASYNHINQLNYVLTASNQTYLLITTHFSQYKRVFGVLLSDFWSTSPKIDDSWPQISPILPTTASYNNINQLKYVLTSSNQTYLLITTHFSRYRRVFGKLLSEFWSTSPKIVIFGPKFHLFCSREIHIMISISRNMF